MAYMKMKAECEKELRELESLSDEQLFATIVERKRNGVQSEILRLEEKLQNPEKPIIQVEGESLSDNIEGVDRASIEEEIAEAREYYNSDDSKIFEDITQYVENDVTRHTVALNTYSIAAGIGNGLDSFDVRRMMSDSPTAIGELTEDQIAEITQEMKKSDYVKLVRMEKFVEGSAVALTITGIGGFLAGVAAFLGNQIPAAAVAEGAAFVGLGLGALLNKAAEVIANKRYALEPKQWIEANAAGGSGMDSKEFGLE